MKPGIVKRLTDELIGTSRNARDYTIETVKKYSLVPVCTGIVGLGIAGGLIGLYGEKVNASYSMVQPSVERSYSGGNEADFNLDGVVDEYDKEDMRNGYIGNQLIVRFEDSVTGKRKEEIIAQYGLTLLRTSGNRYLLEVPRNDLEKIYEAMNNNPEIDLAGKNGLFQNRPIDSTLIEIPPNQINEAGGSFPNDPMYTYQWGPPAMNLPASWVYFTSGNPSVKVAVMDTGFYIAHEDLAHLAGNVEKYNAIDGSSNVDPSSEDTTSHGTKVLGVLAAKMDNNKGIAGVAPDVSYMLIKACLDTTQVCNDFDYADAIQWADDNGADVLSISVGAQNSPFIYDGLLHAVEISGVAVFVAAGNENDQGGIFPASHPSVMAVGAVDSNLVRASFSNYGSDFIFAPGYDIITTEDAYSDAYVLTGGTSFAAPHVAGLAALYLSHVPPAYRTANKVYAYVQNSALSLSPSSTYGYGFAQVFVADFMGKEHPGDCRFVDSDGNTIIDAVDAQSVAFRWATQVGDQYYHPKYDVYPYENGATPDGEINIYDLQTVFGRFNRRCPY